MGQHREERTVVRGEENPQVLCLKSARELNNVAEQLSQPGDQELKELHVLQERL